MTVTAQSPFKPGYPRCSPEKFESVMVEIGSPWAHKARALYDLILSRGHDPAVWLAIGVREHRLLTDPDAVALKLETNSWTNARSVRLAGLEYDVILTMELQRAGILDRNGPYIRYRSVEDSLRDGMARVDDPSYVYQLSGAVSIEDVLSIWTESEAIDYIATTVTRINDWNDTMALTDLIRERIAAKGLDVHDIRDRMVWHKALTYRRLPPQAWLYTGVHHTGVSRGGASLDSEINSWIGHSRYHTQADPQRGKDEWPGIAYAIGFSQSGRVFILRDIELEGYHAFTANANTIGICGDLGSGNQPTTAILVALRLVLHVLHFETPELSALRGYSQTYGHQELSFIDSRNQSGCPGNLLPFVRDYRAGKFLPDSGSPDEGPPALPSAQPDPWGAQNPRQGIWIPTPFVDFINDAGRDWMSFGYALSGAEAEGNQIVQYFERARLELNRDGSITRGLVGHEAMQARYPERGVGA